MSPIFIRPVREQLEHDRLIRFLQVKYKRKLEAAINVGEDRAVPVKIGAGTFFPDLVLTSGKKLAGLVEVETGESVNNLEAMAQWVHFSRARAPFHLYVPVSGYDTARRLCAATGARPTEIWTYRGTYDGFDLVRIHHDPGAVAAAAKSEAAQGKTPSTAAAKGKTPAARPSARPAKPAKSGKPAKAAKPVKAAARKIRPRSAAGAGRKKR